MAKTTKLITEDLMEIAMDLLRPFMSEEHRQEILAERMRQEHGGHVLTCAYCGVSYPPGTPNLQDQFRTQHGLTCSGNPIRADLRKVILAWNTGTTAEMNALTKDVIWKYHFGI